MVPHFSVPNTSMMGLTRQADSQLAWPMLWSGSTKTAVPLRIPITCFGQALT